MNLQIIHRPRKLGTAEAAAVLRVKPGTLRRSFCLNGHYLGLRPVKLGNGRLLWDAAEIDRIVGGEAQK